MSPAEILRALADMIDRHSEKNSSPNQAVLTPVDVDHTDDTETSVMIPPLQQKMELLKKAAGVDNQYDQTDDSDYSDDQEGCGCSASNDEPDELDRIRKIAGISPVVQHEAGEDNDITG